MMGLEVWDAERGKYVLYRSAEEHAEDCKRYPYEQVPGRVFLDTVVINRLVKWGAHIFEQEELPELDDVTLANDVEALSHIFFIGRRAHWELVASKKTLEELSNTPDTAFRSALLDYGFCFVGLHPESEDRRFAEDFSRRLTDSTLIAALPDRADRQLVGHAIGLGCDVFCTCDRKTVLRKRDKLRHLPLRFLSPTEWWAHVKPWAGLWM
jgi:hypothetical protein